MSVATIRNSLIVILLMLPPAASAQELYRYKDENGSTVLNNSIPAKYIASGYEVLDARTGKVIDRVAPVVIDKTGNTVYMTPDDKILLSSYSSVDEIEEHLQRKVAKLEAEVANIQTDKRVTGLELERQLAELQRLTDREREIPAELTAHIAELEQSNNGLDLALERREKDLNQTIDEYETKMRRFEILKTSDVR